MAYKHILIAGRPSPGEQSAADKAVSMARPLQRESFADSR